VSDEHGFTVTSRVTHSVTIAYIEDECFQAITCTGTDNNNNKQQTLNK